MVFSPFKFIWHGHRNGLVKCHYVAVSQDRAHVTPYIITYIRDFVKGEREILHCVNEFLSIIIGIWGMVEKNLGRRYKSEGKMLEEGQEILVRSSFLYPLPKRLERLWKFSTK